MIRGARRSLRACRIPADGWLACFPMRGLCRMFSAACFMPHIRISDVVSSMLGTPSSLSGKALHHRGSLTSRPRTFSSALSSRRSSEPLSTVNLFTFSSSSSSRRTKMPCAEKVRWTDGKVCLGCGCGCKFALHLPFTPALRCARSCAHGSRSRDAYVCRRKGNITSVGSVEEDFSPSAARPWGTDNDGWSTFESLPAAEREAKGLRFGAHNRLDENACVHFFYSGNGCCG